jgi:hypothetical protein
MGVKLRIILGHSGVIVTQIVDFLCEFEAIFKKAFSRVSWAKGELFDEKKNQRPKISCQSPFQRFSPIAGKSI